ncbi:hypothetical protein [Devosia ginsengisoli]|uniref:Uncharacterized protein n=1 Tax=Devosia ginsengisoli TaxID=400770 RepID=A0A5B8LQU4_9HYPH|nr:hypothetical protein [Devosia ginsengisoli]QDZ10523.1 hypothetical protein FPZ08_07025 [Devosia ginsengisoli]
MTPERAIAKLDRQLSRHGQAIAFKRGATEQAAVGFVRGYKAEQLVGLITQQDREVVVSPSSLATFQPKENDDFIITAGAKLGKVMTAEPIHIGTTPVRWNLRVRLT